MHPAWKRAVFDTCVVFAAAITGFVFARGQSSARVAPVVTTQQPSRGSSSEPSLRAVPEVRPLRGEVAKLPAVERLSQVLDARDLPRTARHLLDAIAALSAADFHALGEGTARLPSVMAYGIDESFGAAFARSFIERWLAVDESGALDSLPALAKRAQVAGSFDAAPVLRALIAARPRETLRSFLAMEPDDAGGPVSSGLKEAFTHLAAENPASARAVLADCRDARQRQAAELGIALGLAESDPVSGAAVAAQMKSDEVFRAALSAAEKKGDGAVFEVALKGNAILLPTYTLTGLALRFPGAPWESIPAEGREPSGGVTVDVLDTVAIMPPAARTRLLERSADFPAFMKDAVRNELLSAWVSDAPRDAVEWARTNAAIRNTAEGTLGSLFAKWQTQDRAAAIAWLESVPDAALREGLAPWIRSAPKSPEEKPDLAGATAHALAAPENSEAASHFDLMVKEWFASDAEAASQWASSLTDSRQKDRAFRAYARAAVDRDTAAARAWIDAISDPHLRADGVSELVRASAGKDKAGMREWLGTLRDIEPLRKQWLLRITE